MSRKKSMLSTIIFKCDLFFWPWICTLIDNQLKKIFKKVFNKLDHKTIDVNEYKIMNTRFPVNVHN